MCRCVNRWPGATIGRHSLSHALAGVTAPSEREPGTAAPFIQPLKNRNVAGDFHRPYEGSENFGFYHSTNDTPSVTPNGRASSLREGAGNGLCHSSSRPKTARLRAIFIAPTKGLPKNFRFPPGERYRVGQGTTVLEPAKSVTKRGRVGKLSPGGNHADCIPGGQSGHGPGGTSLYRQLRNEKTAAVNIPPQPIFCAKSSLPPYLQEPDTQPILSSYPDFAPHRPAAPPSQG